MSDANRVEKLIAGLHKAIREPSCPLELSPLLMECAQVLKHSADDGARPHLNDRQKAALRIGEQAIEDLPFRDRDDLISKKLAIRAWPKVTCIDWKTWLTPRGAALRLSLFDPVEGERQERGP